MSESLLSTTTPTSNLDNLTKKETVTPVVKNKVTTTDYSRVTNQLKIFNDFLENKLLDAQIYCDVYANYNNVLYNKSMDSTDFQSAFPETQETYKNRCSSSYLEVSQNQKILIAEPELQPLRLILTNYSNEAKEFGLYALSGKYEAYVIDSADKKMDNLRTLAREEVVRLKNKYYIQ